MLKISQQTTIKLIVAINTLANLHFFLFQGPASPHRLTFPHPPHSRGLSRRLRNAALWRSLRHCVPPPCSSISDAAPDRAFLTKKRLTLSCKAFFGAPSVGALKNSVRSACRPVKPPFCFAKPLVRLYAARGVHCSLPAFAHAQSWPLLTNPQPFLATSPRETNTSACAKCESVPKGMVRQKSRNIRCGFSWCTIGDSNPGPTD